MRKQCFYLTTVAIVVMTFSSLYAAGNSAVPNITLTTAKSDSVWMYLRGFGEVIINWGDGTNKTYTIDNDGEQEYIHTYSESSEHTVTITGESITGLICSEMQITSLDVSNSPELQYLFCNSNQLISLDVSRNTKLQTLVCSHNQLISLDVSNNTELQNLYCSYNQLISLDVSRNTALKHLRCEMNQLTDLDVSNSPELQALDCSNNKLINLNVSRNTELEILLCNFNKLISLDVSNDKAMSILFCGNNQLTHLDVTNLENLSTLNCPSNKLQAGALNDLFTMLCENNSTNGYFLFRFIDVSENPGAYYCDTSIATKKRWEVDYKSLY